MMIRGALVGVVTLLTLMFGEAAGLPSLPDVRDLPRQPSVASAAGEVLLAAGDIASCASTGDEQTADLLDTLSGTVLVMGDLAYNNGTTTEFNNCYHPTWGRHKARTMPSPGNHEYNTPGATGYYGYFGAAAGDPAKGYYSFDVGEWHIISLNSNCGAVACAAGSTQEQWLRADLAAHPATCTLAYWHHPRFSSGDHGNSVAMQPFWQALYDYGAEVALVGHDHTYERFAPQTPAGALDTTNGIREFVVGTGGRSHYTFDGAEPNSEVRNGTTYGVLKLTLQPASYEWEFVPVAGQTFTDSGTGACQAGAPGDDDLDGIADAVDNCPSVANAGQQNTDGNVIDLSPPKAYDDTTRAFSDTPGDACDDDDDGDGIDDADEASGAACGGVVTNAGAADSDGDNHTDGAECALGTNPNVVASKPTMAQCGATSDADGDGLPTFREVCLYGTDPANANSDGDARADGCEVASINAADVVNVVDLQQIASESGTYALPGSVVKVNFDITRNGSVDVADLQQAAARIAACG